MRLTTKGRFAVISMIDVSLRDHGAPVSLAAIAQRQKISVSYLEQLFAKLRQHELVESTRGPGGGYRLARPMESISVADIVFAVDGALESVRVDAAASNGGQSCVPQELWHRLNRQMIDFLDTVSLRDLAQQQRSAGARVNAASGSLAGGVPAKAALADRD